MLIRQVLMQGNAVLYSMDDNAEMLVYQVVEKLEKLIEKSTGLKQFSECVAQSYNIPLNNPQDNFLENAEHMYLLGDNVLEQSIQCNKNQVTDNKTDGVQTRVLKDAIETSLLNYRDANEGTKANTRKYNLADGQDKKNEDFTNANMIPVEQGLAKEKKGTTFHAETNKIVHQQFEQPQQSMNASPANIQTIWGCNSDGLSPKFDGSFAGHGSLLMLPINNDDPFMDNPLDDYTSGIMKQMETEIIKGTDDEIASRRSILGLCKADNCCMLQNGHQGKCKLLSCPQVCLQKAELALTEGKPKSSPVAMEGSPAKSTEEDNALIYNAPLCYCGEKCVEKNGDSLGRIWCCERSTCNAQMPVHNEDAGDRNKQKVIVTKRSKNDSHQRRKPPKYLNEYETSLTHGDGVPTSGEEEDSSGILDGRHDLVRFSRKERIQSDGKNIVIDSYESSGKKGSLTVFKGSKDSLSIICSRSDFCSKNAGHTGRCNRKRPGANFNGKKT